MARKKIREYDSKRLLKEYYKRLCGKELPIKSAQVSTLAMGGSLVNLLWAVLRILHFCSIGLR